MPASSIDTFFACALMVMLIVSAMASMLKILYPYLYGLSSEVCTERFQQLTDYLLLNPGAPANWGCLTNNVPSSFGLASANSSYPYMLDVDKVSRLNSENQYAISYAQMWEALNTEDVSLRIEFQTLFDLSINFISSQSETKQTTYNFTVTTQKMGLPITTDLHYYIVAENYVQNASSSTSSNGYCSIRFSIPNWANGTALLIVFAKAKANQQSMAFNFYTFGHNASTPMPRRTFVHLSPLNYTVHASFLYANEEILRTQVFTYNYCFNLTKIVEEGTTAQYRIPHLLDPSPMILVVYGLNGTVSFAEWVAYPQLPLAFGADFDAGGSNVVSFSYIVSINSVLYLATVKCGGLS